MMVEAHPDRRLQTLKGFYRNYIRQYYDDAHRARAEGKPVAWVASTFPVEMLLAMDVTPIWPENYASVCAAKQVSVRLCEAAEREGFSRDLCSYARCVLGSLFEAKELPEGGMPKPDFLVASTGACDTHLKWFQVASRRLKSPLFLLDVPYGVTGADSANVERHCVEHYVNQLEELVSFLEEQADNKLDPGRLQKTITLSDQTSNLWMKIQNYRKITPTPMGARDAFSAVFFMLCIPGTRVAVDFYERLAQEVGQRAKTRFGRIENEKHRLIWDNLPMWFDLQFFDYLNSLGAIVVAETFSHVWAGALDPSNPFESLARKYLPNFANCVIERRLDLMRNLAKEFGADGIIIPTNWGCRMMSIGMTIVKDVIKKELGVPSLIIDVDSSDWRTCDKNQVRTKLEGFLEMLG